MTAKIPKSVVDSFPDFAAQAATHAVAVRQWRGHMARVKEDETKKNLAPIDRHWPIDRPRAPIAIEAAVNENDEMDYEIVDDGPSPEDLLALRKVQLLGAVTRAEQDARATVMPFAKERLFNFLEADIRAKDARVVTSMMEKNLGVFRVAAKAVGLGKKIEPQDIAAAVNAKRTEPEQQHLADMKARRVKMAAIERRAAQAHADVEDLTAETIDAFKIPDFTKD